MGVVGHRHQLERSLMGMHGVGAGIGVSSALDERAGSGQAIVLGLARRFLHVVVALIDKAFSPLVMQFMNSVSQPFMAATN